ncbi:RNA 3'-terminal phosphate cyclase [Candidatus Nanohalococcus occultus]|uniref:RNA 3'-terminal phosphate cyclase n=1 Tax=Candidatus Nanohalococcus occultus TaxID=2978047 RepID=UPI0039E1EF40
MIEIDGKAGGGQILRTALSMSAIKGEDFRIENIRGSRSDPGLKSQHLECVRTIQRLCDAEVKGAELSSEKLVFKPNKLEPENLTVDIGTAGSISLLIDSVLPLITQFNEDFRLTVKGGTHVRYSPAFESLEAKLDLLERFGLQTEIRLEKTGYYPKGGGKITLTAEPSSMKPVVLTNRGKLKSLEIRSKASVELEEKQVADRQLEELLELLVDRLSSVLVEKDSVYVDTLSTGSSLVLKADYGDSLAVFDALGERGKRSEQVASEVFEQFETFENTEGAIDRHLADQLMVFMGLAGGKIRVPEITPHIQTNLEVLKKFGVEIGFEVQDSSALISVRP